MELGPAERKDDEGAGARASPSTSSPSCEVDEDKDHPKQQQRVIGGGDGDDDDDDEGTRQPYKCTFCRRGFPTAQALGGHMNAHRRHRGRPAAEASASVVYDYDQQPCSTMTTTSSTPPVLTFAQQATRTTRPAAGGSVAALHAQRKPHELLPLFGRGDCCAAGRGSGAAAGDVREDHRYFAIAEEGDGGEELDLELRLGSAGAGS